jgi:imidazoleglycerol phosphate synthase glutamine amidotransferase subunit HisH
MDEVINTVDYGAGNLHRIATAVAKPNCGSRVTCNLGDAPRAAAAILPGSISTVIRLDK